MKRNKNKKVGRIVLWCILGLVAVICLFLLFAYINHKLTNNPDIPASAENNTGLVRAIGRGFYDKDGNEIVFRGVNAGNTFITEGWLAPYCIAEPEGENYPELSEEMFMAGIRSNPNLTEAQIQDLLDVYRTSFFTEDDVARIAEMGMNCLRVPFFYTMILNEDFSRKDEAEAFKYLDDICAWCAKYGVYVVLDLHGAPGSQNAYEHSGSIDYDKHDKSKIRTWYVEEYIAATVDLWDYISDHYKDSELGRIIAAYDLLNEPRSRAFKTDKTCWEGYDRIYQAIRENGDQHVIMMEGCWDFGTLPDPEKYGWENVSYSYHWYNWPHNYVTYTLFFMYQDLSNIGRNYEVPVLIGEFTAFDVEKDWNSMLGLFDERHYSWTVWTYKMAVYGWWENSWGLYNLNYWEGEDYDYARKVNVTTATYDEIRAAFEWTVTDNATPGSTYKTIKNFLANH